MTIDDCKAKLAAHDMRQQRTADRRWRRREIKCDQLRLGKAIGITRLKNRLPQFFEQFDGTRKGPRKHRRRWKLPIDDTQFAGAFEIRLHLATSSLELVVDRGERQASHLPNLAARVPVKEMQDEIAGALGRLLSPDRVGADTTKIILPLEKIARPVAVEGKVERIKVGCANEVESLARRASETRKKNMAQAGVYSSHPGL